MARRPAARPAPRRNNSASPRKGGANGARRNGNMPIPGWVWLLAGAAITLFIVVVVHLTQPRHAKSTAPEAVARPAPAAAVHAPVKPVPLPPKQAARFSFYKLLPSHEVVIPSDEAEQAVKAKQGGKPLPANLAAPGAYVVQIGAYRTRAQAEQSRAKVALLGVEAHTEQVTLSAGDIWYRVRVGPEASLGKAQAIVNLLHTNGAKAILIKQKS